MSNHVHQRSLLQLLLLAQESADKEMCCPPSHVMPATSHKSGSHDHESEEGASFVAQQADPQTPGQPVGVDSA